MSRHEAGQDSSKCHQNFDVINVFLQSVWVLSNWHLLSKSCSVRRVLTNWYLQEKMTFPVRGFILLTSIAWRPWRHTTMEKTETAVLHFHFSRKSKACSDFLPEKKKKKRDIVLSYLSSTNHSAKYMGRKEVLILPFLIACLLQSPFSSRRLISILCPLHCILFHYKKLKYGNRKVGDPLHRNTMLFAV